MIVLEFGFGAERESFSIKCNETSVLFKTRSFCIDGFESKSIEETLEKLVVHVDFLQATNLGIVGPNLLCDKIFPIGPDQDFFGCIGEASGSGIFVCQNIVGKDRKLILKINRDENENMEKKKKIDPNFLLGGKKRSAARRSRY